MNCPIECPEKYFDLNRVKNCESCEKQLLFDKFKSETLSEWRKNHAKTAAKFRFDDLLSLLYSVINGEDSPKNLRSVKSDHLLNVWLAEKARKQQIEDFNRRENDKN